ncbi:LamB/YcsF family protein [Teichococcus oryzae]|uniref:5-oxoprolinase subunit A n=1 Tax=Teichococcus oryzae TaxID=1608942 RepID=A0A5B2TEP5_9PROT|nr:5-oxoprolinase subunit PxpA [Pseudoroseomonas oryzae]KAA2212972.1 LamB/YcsF family protein [Pseudoroseomonas oryzae]
MGLQVDLNSDMGESFGAYRIGDDDAMLSIITSANVACGFHGGDPEVMAHAYRVAKANGVAAGAHPGFPDLWGFGRRRIPFSTGEIERFVAYQIGAAQAMAAYTGHRLTYVKAHGALGNLAAEDASVAAAIARAIKAVDPSLIMVAIALTRQVAAGEEAGLRTVHEIFADRGVGEDGNLIARGQPGAMIEDADQAADRILAMLRAKAVITSKGAHLPSPIDTICVHGDSAHAVGMARRVRERLEAAGVTLAPFSG